MTIPMVNAIKLPKEHYAKAVEVTTDVNGNVEATTTSVPVSATERRNRMRFY
jgi:hypothetical protein